MRYKVLGSATRGARRAADRFNEVEPEVGRGDERVRVFEAVLVDGGLVCHRVGGRGGAECGAECVARERVWGGAS